MVARHPASRHPHHEPRSPPPARPRNGKNLPPAQTSSPTRNHGRASGCAGPRMTGRRRKKRRFFRSRPAACVGFPAPPGLTRTESPAFLNSFMSTTKPSSQSLIRSLSQGLFCDVNPADLDPDQHAQWLVPRVVERGTRSDVDAIFDYYDETTIRDALGRKSKTASAANYCPSPTDYNSSPCVVRVISPSAVALREGGIPGPLRPGHRRSRNNPPRSRQGPTLRRAYPPLSGG